MINKMLTDQLIENQLIVCKHLLEEECIGLNQYHYDQYHSRGQRSTQRSIISLTKLNQQLANIELEKQQIQKQTFKIQIQTKTI